MTQRLLGQVVLSSILEGVDTTGTVATFSDANTSDVAGDFTATVNWGDGTTEVGTVTGQNGSFAVAVPGSTHFYSDKGTDTITVTVTGTAVGNVAPTNLHYFLAIDGLDGGSTDAAHAGWFEVSSYDVGALVAALSGSATFSPLTVTLPSTGLTGLLADLAKGTKIKSVQLEGVTGGANPQAVYDLTLGNVSVSNYDDASGGDKLSFSYQQVALTTTAINPNGSLSSQSFAWDLTTNSVPSGSIPTPVPSTAAGNVAPTNLHYFLAIDGLDGGSTDAAHAGWFEVSSYDVGALVAALSGSATFSPLTVTLPSTGLTGLLADLAKGTKIKSVQLEGVTGGANPQAVYDLTLGNVSVSNYDDASGGDKLSFSYQQVALTTTAINPNGSLSSQSFAWDLTTNSVPSGSIPTPVPSTAAGNVAPTNLHYFLAIDGLDGGSTDAAHAGWFEVSSYDVGALVAALSGSATFSPLTVTLPSTGLTGLLADLAKGTKIKSVQLEGVTGGANPQAVYDLTLGNVSVSNYDDASGGDKLSFSYQQVALTTTAINPNGSLSSQSFAWDLTTNSVPSGSIPTPVPSTAAGNVAPTNLHYFLAIDGLDGGSTDAAHAGWFEVSSYDVGALVAALSGSATFSPLTVTLPSTGLTGLLADLAKGTKIKSVQLEGVTGGANPQAVYDLTLGNVSVSNYDDASGGDKLSFSYQQVALTTTAINPNGSLSSQSFAWDLTTNSVPSGSIPTPVPSTAAGNVAPTNLHYFLAIDGLDGGSTDAAHAGWFEVSSYDVGALVAALSGSATFSPLTVTLPSTGLTGLLADLAKGTKIKSVQLEGVTGGANPQAVYDLTLGNVSVSNYDDASGGDKLSFSYQQVALTTTAINPNGSLSSQSFAWDLTTNSVPSGSIPTPVPSTAAGNVAPTNLHYFLAIDGLDGGSTDAAHAGWFEVSSYDVGALVAALSGSATFSPLTVTLPSTGLTGLLADLAKGTKIKSVQLEGVTGGANPQAVYDLTLGNVSVSNYDDASGGDKLSFSYQQVALTTTAINPNGSLSSQSFAWDLTTNSIPSGSIPTPVPSTTSNQITLTGTVSVEQLLGQVVLSSILEGVDTTGTVATFSDANTSDVAGDFTATVNWGDGTTEVGTVTGQNGSFAVAVPGSTHFYSDKGTDTITVTVTGTAVGNVAPTNLHYFLAIDGLDGGSTDAAHAGWFEVSSYDVGALVAALSGSATFSPLTVTLPSTGLTGLLADLAKGTKIKSVQLEGVTGGANPQAVYDLTLGNVSVSNYDDASGGDKLSFSYQQVALTTTAINPNGSLSSQSFAWDLTTNSIPSGSIPTPVPSTAAGNVAPTNLHYFLAIDGLDGGSTDAAHAGWFEVSSYDVGALVAALSGSATFSPLTVTLPSTGLTGLLADLAKGTKIKSVQLEGVTGGANPQAVYDLTLGNVSVSNYDDASGGDKLSFSYQQVALTTTAINPNGSLSSQSFAWDLTTNSVPSGSIPTPVPSTAAGNVAPTNLHYFLAIDGLDGGSTDAAHAGWFEVSSYDVGALVAALSGSATFSPLTVTLPSTGLTGLLADLAKGTKIKSVQLEGVTGGANPQAVYDLTLGNVSVSNYDDASGGDKLSFSYQQVALTTTAINPNGSLSSQSFAWDLTTNSVPSGSIPTPVPSTAAGNVAPTNLHYFLAIDGLDGGSTDAAHAGWFEVSSYDVGALVAALSGSATFSPLTVTLPSTGLTGLLADLAKGTKIKSVQLEGVTGGANPQAVYDLTLGNVSVSNYDDASGGDKLSFSYQQVALTTTAINPNGSLSSQSFAWDLTTNSVPSGSIPTPVPSTAAGNVAPTNLHYFLAIDGLDGGSTDAAHAGWFEVSSYDVGALVAALSGSATFSPLTVTLPSTGLTGLLADLAKGTKIKSVQLEGVTGGANPQAVYDLTLGNVSVSNYDDASGGDKLSFSYQQVALTTTAINPNGSLSSQSFAWDLTTNSVPSGSIPTPVPSTAAGNVAPTNLHYFLAIDGLDGGSTDAAHAGWFEVSSYDVGALVAALSGSATFSPLTVTLPSTGLTGLLADLAKGTKIKSVQLEGVTGGANPQAVYDLTLGNVSVSNYDDASGGDKLSFSYQQVALTTTAINPNGSLSSQSFAWDLTTNSIPSGSIPTPVPSTTSNQITLTGTVSVAPAGPSITSVTPSVVEKGQTTEVATVTPGLAGDTLTLQQTGGSGKLALQLVNGVEEVIYTAPSVIVASTLDKLSYTISDQHNDTMATGSASVQLDAGPSITSVTPSVVEKGQTTEVATVTPGLAGDTLTLQQTGGSGKLALQLVNGVEEVIYTAPSAIAASTLDKVSYTISDQHNDTMATGSASVQLDAGPSITSVTPSVVEKGQTTEVATVTPGLAGDTPTLQQTGGSGKLALQLVNGVEEVIYTAPSVIAASTLDKLSYTISDQHNDTMATGSASVQLDAGPSITSVTPSVVEKGQTTEVATVTLGLAGDTLTLQQTGGSGKLALQLVNGVEEVIYTAPSAIANTLDTVSYTIADQHNDAVATGSNTVPVAAAGDTIYVGTAGRSISVGNLNSAIDGRAGNERIAAGNGTDVIFGGPNDTITAGSGDDTIYSGANSSITAGVGNDKVTAEANSSIKLGNGNDTVIAGANNTITVGNGNDNIFAGANDLINLGTGHDTVIAGANNTITVGNGNDNIFAGANDLINLGTGNDTVAFGESPNPITIGKETINGFNPAYDILQFNPALLMNYAAAFQDIKQVGANTVIQIDPTNSVTLDNVNAHTLTANNFHFS